jgi:hypothetical protein
MAKSFWKTIGDLLIIPPIYADRPSDAVLAEGWKIAYQQEKERRELAEAKLALCEDRTR